MGKFNKKPDGRGEFHFSKGAATPALASLGRIGSGLPTVLVHFTLALREAE